MRMQTARDTTETRETCRSLEFCTRGTGTLSLSLFLPLVSHSHSLSLWHQSPFHPSGAFAFKLHAKATVRCCYCCRCQAEGRQEERERDDLHASMPATHTRTPGQTAREAIDQMFVVRSPHIFLPSCVCPAASFAAAASATVAAVPLSNGHTSSHSLCACLPDLCSCNSSSRRRLRVRAHMQRKSV